MTTEHKKNDKQEGDELGDALQNLRGVAMTKPINDALFEEALARVEKTARATKK